MDNDTLQHIKTAFQPYVCTIAEVDFWRSITVTVHDKDEAIVLPTVMVKAKDIGNDYDLAIFISTIKDRIRANGFAIT